MMEQLKAKRFDCVTVLPDGRYVVHAYEHDVALTDDECTVIDFVVFHACKTYLADYYVQDAISAICKRLSIQHPWLACSGLAQYVKEHWEWVR